MAYKNKLNMKDAVAARNAITAQQKDEIHTKYLEWKNELSDKYYKYKNKTTASAPFQARVYKELRRSVNQTAHNLSDEIDGIITGSLHTVGDNVVEHYVDWLKDLGFDGGALNATFGSVADNAIRNLLTGQVYDTGWSLSKAIWSDNEATMKNAYEIVARGLAENAPIYETAKLLEQYVNPDARKKWNLKCADGKKIYPKQVDYASQRLARTLTQHTYQQTLEGLSKDNPFISGYIWESNGSRVCPICKQRDGQFFKKGELPLDHPNGMCIMEPVIDDNYTDKLVDWYNSSDGIYPEIDNFAKTLGYEPLPASTKTTDNTDSIDPATKLAMELDKKYDIQGCKDWSELIDHIYEHGYTTEEFTNETGIELGIDTFNQFLQDTKYVLANQAAKSKIAPNIIQNAEDAFFSKWEGNNKVSFSYWYSKLSPEEKEQWKQFKQMSGLTNQQMYDQKVLPKMVGEAKKKTKAQPKPIATKQASNSVFDKTSWIKQIKSQEERERLDSEQAQLSKMTDKQIEALRTYTGSAYMQMNGYLRCLGTGMSKKEAEEESGITSNLIAQTHKLINGLKQASNEKEGIILRRGTSYGELAGFMQGDYYTNKGKVMNMSITELKNRFEGTVGQYESFISTSSLYDRGFSGDVEMIYYVPKGAPVTSVMSVSKYGTGEGETLMNYHTRIKIHEIEESHHLGSDIRVYAEVLIDENN